MTQLPNTDADGEAQIENGMVNEKQPLNNGIADKALIIENADRTDDVHVPRAEHEKPSLFQKSSKRKYKTYDNGKRTRINLAPLTARRIRIENALKLKTGLTRTGLILAILCVVLTILSVGCIFWRPKTTKTPVCVKPSCLRSSFEILPKLNLNESPCSNFHDYACGNWFTSNPLPKDRSEWNLKELMLRTYRQKVRELLMTKIVTITSNASVWKMKKFYESCMEVATSSNSEVLLKDRILSLGGWVADNAELPKDWNINRVLGRLHSEFNISPFFQIDVGSDPTNTTQNVVFLKPPVLGLPNLDFYNGQSPKIVDAYKHYIRDILQHFGVTVYSATRKNEEIFGYETRLAHIMMSRKENVTRPYYTRMKLKDLHLNPIQLHNILGIMLSSVSLETTVLIENIEYFSELPTLISTSNPASLNIYVIWRLVAEYVPYLSEKFLETLYLFNKEIYDNYEPLPRWEFCISMLQKFAGFGLMALFENEFSMEDRERVQSVVSQIFSETSSIVKKNFVKLRQFDMQQKNTNKLNQIGIQIGLPMYMLKQQYIDDYYSNLNIISDSFFVNIGNGISFRRDILQKKLKQSREDSWLDNMISFPVAVTYDAVANYIIVPWPMLQQPYFEKDYPLTNLYGGIGVEMAKAFVRSLIPQNSKEETNKYVSVISECALGKDFTNLDVTNRAEFVVTLAGLKFSYECLKDELSLVESSQLPAMESFKDEELLFIYYTQSICTVKINGNKNTFSNSSNNYLLSNAVLSELSEFTELYSCDQSSKYSSSLCAV